MAQLPLEGWSTTQPSSWRLQSMAWPPPVGETCRFVELDSTCRLMRRFANVRPACFTVSFRLTLSA